MSLTLADAILAIYGYTFRPGEIARVDRCIRDIAAAISKRTRVAGEMPPIDVLRRLFSYEPHTGIIRRATKRRRGRLGAVVGEKTKRGYIRIDVRIGGRRYRLSANRVAWALYYGVAPPVDMTVHHDDPDRANNAINNLCLLTTTSNNYQIPADVLGKALRAQWAANTKSPPRPEGRSG